ncbi:hypothetical protein PGT21_009745 [Puccinia graminis f. sp. tritici]|uniref:RNA-polymerase II-associated protein 3-like C-terminal domain-containing protein n=1 Tax=Puccinia graminis f. sp. tritici TaxID=56615 RepID=A0A5B0PT34_PUCGR|nr:hypothetical protein PGT21_009745 [Puccinia graminis f. sp. tritici]
MSMSQLPSRYNYPVLHILLIRLPANDDHHDFEDLKAALALEPNNASICAELEAVKSHLQKDTIIPETSSPPKASSPNSTVSSDSESSSANQPTPGPSSSTALTDKRSSDSFNSLMKEVSTTRFTSSDPKNFTTKAAAGTSFSALKQIRQKKEEKSSGLLTSRNPKPSASSPTDLSKCEAKPTKIPSSSSTNSIPPVRSFADFEMRWGMSSQPELRCSVLEALDQRHVARLFGEHLEPETLEQIIDAMQVLLKSNEKAKIKKAVELLQEMDNVSRMGTLTMFLGSDHQKVIQDLLIKFQGFEGKSVKLNNWGL